MGLESIDPGEPDVGGALVVEAPTTPSAIRFHMGPLRYSINVTLDGCCDHRVGVVDEGLHRHAVENVDRPMPFSSAG